MLCNEFACIRTLDERCSELDGECIGDMCDEWGELDAKGRTIRAKRLRWTNGVQILQCAIKLVPAYYYYNAITNSIKVVEPKIYFHYRL